MAAEANGDTADWRGDFRASEERLLEISLAATPSERLKWLEEALAFAARCAELHQHGPTAASENERSP